MKTIKGVLDICNNFTYYNHYSIGRVIELIHVRDYIIDILSKCDHIDEHLHKSFRCYR